jgi:hypothetical protein
MDRPGFPGGYNPREASNHPPGCGGTNVRGTGVAGAEGRWLGDVDSNHDTQNQNLQSYH